MRHGDTGWDNAVTALPRYAKMEMRVLQLARAGADDAEIARQLTAEGHRSPSRTEVLCSTVQGIRLRHRLKMPPTRWAKIPGRLSIPEVATDLGVSANWVSGRIRRGVIRIDRDPDIGRFLFPDTDETMTALRQLRAGAIARVDLTQDHREQEGHQDA